jgi:hypothetical protein
MDWPTDEPSEPVTDYGYGFAPFGLSTSVRRDGTTRTIVREGSTLTAGGVTFTFDALGRITSKGDLTLAYGPDSQIATATRSGDTFSYVYDEDGLRLLRSSNGTPTMAAGTKPNVAKLTLPRTRARPVFVGCPAAYLAFSREARSAIHYCR